MPLTQLIHFPFAFFETQRQQNAGNYPKRVVNSHLSTDVFFVVSANVLLGRIHFPCSHNKDTCVLLSLMSFIPCSQDRLSETISNHCSVQLLRGCTLHQPAPITASSRTLHTIEISN